MEFIYLLFLQRFYIFTLILSNHIQLEIYRIQEEIVEKRDDRPINPCTRTCHIGVNDIIHARQIRITYKTKRKKWQDKNDFVSPQMENCLVAKLKSIKGK